MGVLDTKFQLPATDEPMVLRTDFSNEMIWKQVCEEIQTPEIESGFLAYVIFESNQVYADYSIEQIVAASEANYDHQFIFIVDKITLSTSEYAILCLGLKDNLGMQFRTIPSEMWGIENNLSISNMDFEDFAESIDADGIFRGF